MTITFDSMALSLVPMIMFTVLAHWKPRPELFMFAAGAAAFSGFYLYNSQDNNAGLLLALGLLLIGYSIYCFVMAFRYIFKRSKTED